MANLTHILRGSPVDSYYLFFYLFMYQFNKFVPTLWTRTFHGIMTDNYSILTSGNLKPGWVMNQLGCIWLQTEFLINDGLRPLDHCLSSTSRSLEAHSPGASSGSQRLCSHQGHSLYLTSFWLLIHKFVTSQSHGGCYNSKLYIFTLVHWEGK